MIKVFKASDNDFSSNGEVILQPISAVINKSIEEEYIEIESPLKYADFLIQDNVLLVDTLTGKKRFQIFNPVASDTITVKAWLVYQDSVPVGADRGAVIAHGKNLSNCKVNQNWDNVVTKIIPIGYNDAVLPEGYLSIPTPYQKVYEKTVEFELSESLQDEVDALEELIETNSSLKTSLENSLVALEAKTNAYNTSIETLNAEKTALEERLASLGDTEPELKERDIITAQIPLIDADIAKFNEEIPIIETAIQDTKALLDSVTSELTQNKSDYNNIVMGDLRLQAQSYLNANKYPQITYDLEAHLDCIIEIGDTVRVKHPDIKVDLLTNVTAYKWDCLSRRFEQVVFGTLTSTLKGKFSEVDKKIEKVKEDTKNVGQTITKYAAEFRRDDKELYSKFASEVYGSSNGIYGLLEKNASLFRQTASSITAQVTQVDKNLTTRIASLEVTASGITATVSANYNSLHQDITNVDIKANGIQSTVTRIDGDLTTAKSTITQQANQINLRVEKGKVISEINQSAEAIKISANKVDITGFVTFTNLSTPGQSTIDGGNIKANSIYADSIRSGGLLSGVTISNGAVTIDNSNIYITSPSGYIYGKSYTTTKLIGFSGSTIYIGSDTFDSNSYLYMKQRYITIGYGGTSYGAQVKFDTSYLGFYGATPTARKTVNKLSGTQFLSTAYSKINEILTALQSMGLVAGS